MSFFFSSELNQPRSTIFCRAAFPVPVVLRQDAGEFEKTSFAREIEIVYRYTRWCMLSWQRKEPPPGTGREGQMPMGSSFFV